MFARVCVSDQGFSRVFQGLTDPVLRFCGFTELGLGIQALGVEGVRQPTAFKPTIEPHSTLNQCGPRVPCILRYPTP